MSDLFRQPPADLSHQAVLIVVEGEPRGKGRPRFTVRGDGKKRFVQVFTDEQTKDYELEIQMEVGRTLYGQQMAERIWGLRKLPAKEMFLMLQFAPRFNGPVRFEMEIRHPIRESWNKAKKAGALDGSVVPTIKPDADNVKKIFWDAFNGCMWIDDTQVVEWSGRKIFSDNPGVSVRVIPLDLQSA